MDRRDENVQWVKQWVKNAADRAGVELTPEGLQKAAEFGADNWRSGGVGQAGENGLAHVIANSDVKPKR